MDNITKQCESWSKGVGCYHTFDGKCNKENCQLYRLIKDDIAGRRLIDRMQKDIMKLEKRYDNLQKQYENTKGLLTTCQKQLQEALKENEELKEDLKVYHRPDIIKVLTDYRTGELGLLQEKYDILTNKFFNSEANNYKYKHALEEIKKLNEIPYKLGLKTGKLIQKIISEVENE